MGKLNTFEILPLAKGLLAFLQEAIDKTAELKAAGIDLNEDIVGMYLNEKMVDWNPTLKGKQILDEQTKAAGARFLTGIAFNFMR